MEVINNSGKIAQPATITERPEVEQVSVAKLVTSKAGDIAQKIRVAVRMYMNDDCGARSAAFGAITIDTPLGKLTLDNLKILRDQKSGKLSALTPFRIVPNKAEGGAWKKCSDCGELVADRDKSTQYENPYHGDAADTAKAIILSCYEACDGCLSRQVPVDRKKQMQALTERLDELEALPDSEKTEEHAIEYATIISKLSNVYRRCVSTPAFTWDGQTASCNNRRVAEKIEESKAPVEEVSTDELDAAIADLVTV